jgi:hypothetical protein
LNGLATLENSPQEPSPHLVLVRFGIRIIILTTFAALSGVGFGSSFAALAAMASVLCTVVATVRREAVFPNTLNHWDEATAYAMLYFLTLGIGLSSPT